MKKTVRMALVAATAALALTACGNRGSDDKSAGTDENASSDTAAASASASASTSASASSAQYPDFKACMVSDTGGFSDKSFNETSLKGQTDAASQFGVQTAQVESTSSNQYADNINQLISQKCNEITTVGFDLGDATLAAAKANPSVDFAIVDFGYKDPPANLQGLSYNTNEPSYLAGYLAAGMSKSGIVGTFGGENIPTVTIYMEGFRQGILAYNQDSGKDVKLIGWDGKDGSFTDDFVSKTKGQNIGEQLVGQGADIIFPVAGNAGLGGLQAAKDAGAEGIWVDVDGYTATDYGSILLTSAEKGLDTSVTTAIQEAAGGKFSNTPYVGTLANGGVGLAPYHDFDSQIPQALKDKIDELKQQIISGSLVVPGGS